jgi:monofunctional biosynthetic peptidoglycan transglycosylase
VVTCSIVRAEDRRFFVHDGVDWIAMRGAAEDAVREGELRLGGSTIAMQLARNLFFDRDKSLTRKARELSIAPRLVERLGRGRVLELYLNVAEWAPCRYGVEAAAQWWLGHGVDRMDLFEATLLAAILPRPHTPLVPDDATRVARRQGILMRQLQLAGLMSKEQLEAEMAELDRSWRVLVKSGGADDLRAALHARAKEPAHTAAIDARGWLDAKCGRVW